MNSKSIFLGLALLIASPPLAEAQAPNTIKYVVAPQGNEARYRVREQLFGLDAPNDAIGTTTRVDGEITLAPNGAVIKEHSRFTIDLSALTSDKNMRDNFLRRNTLATAQHPHAVFVVTELKNLKFPLPKSGDVEFQVIGDLTVKEVARQVTWDVKAQIANGSISGEAKTQFTFADFQLEKPRVRSVISVDDDIRLEYSFFLVPASQVVEKY